MYNGKPYLKFHITVTEENLLNCSISKKRKKIMSNDIK